jgi:hypothetical protein
VRFSVTWDYRCPFARNFCEHVLVGVADGADWQVRFVPFSLDQVHVGEGEPEAWDDPGKGRSMLANTVGVAVRDGWPEAFGRVHLALFGIRHDRGLDLRDETVLRDTLAAEGLDPDAVFEVVASGGPLATFRAEHEQAVADHAVFGVPTVIVDERAVFVRVMDRPAGDGSVARETVERVLRLLVDCPGLNEFKHTTIPR